MLLFILAYLGGALTIASPCILPVLPFVFSRADQPFARGGLPMLAGMAGAFAFVSTLAAVGGGWAVRANEWGRWAAIALFAVFAVTLIFPALADRAMRPLVAFGGRLSQTAEGGARSGGVLRSLALGVAAGLLWSPCAGPILGLILTGAALRGASVETTALLGAYALGAATSLALALLVGGRALAAMKRSLGAGEWIRRGVGVAVLAAAVAIAAGVDASVLARASLDGAAGLEQRLVDRLRPGPPAVEAAALADEGPMPPLAGATAWLNSPPLDAAALKGKVALVDFWTYSCVNCLRSLPYVRAWAEKYKDHGLVVIGVHTPEFAFERDVDNVKRAVAGLKIDFPVAIDDDYAIWRAFDNQYWPADYFIDAKGRIRGHHFGEGDYAKDEQTIRDLLAEAGEKGLPGGAVSVRAGGAEAAADLADLESPETYLGYRRAENFVSPGGAAPDVAHVYAPGEPRLDQWGLSGDWTVGADQATLDAGGGGVTYQFHARDLHMVLGLAPGAPPAPFRITIDGAAPGDAHGVDDDGDGRGVVTQDRLYQLVRQTGAVARHTFVIQFLAPGVRAYAFTFG